MNIKIQDVVYVPDIENGEYWVDDGNLSLFKGCWTKLLKDRYVLTEDELLEIISDAMLWFDDTDGSIENNAKDFLKSITK